MKNLRMTFIARNRERGSVAIVLAFMWTTLFGMAVLAVDFGYLYTKRRNIQAVADAAVTAGMPRVVANDASGAQTRAQLIANQNGYSGTDIVTNVAGPGTPPTQLTVTLQRTYPTFFGSVLGLTPKTIQATSVGKVVTAGGNTTIQAIGAGCDAALTWGKGVEFTGSGVLKINGDVYASNKVDLDAAAGPVCTLPTCFVTGNAGSPCGVVNHDAAMNVPSIVGTSPADPLAANTLATLEPFCTGGTSTLTPMGAIPMALSGTCDLITPGVYCSNANISVNPVFSTAFCATNVTFISAGTVQLGGNGAITLSNYAGVPGNILIYSAYSGGGPAIQLANGPVGSFTLTGSIYAPLGEINLGTGTPGFTMNGMLVASDVMIAMGPGQPWTFNSPSMVPSGTNWHLFR